MIIQKQQKTLTPLTSMVRSSRQKINKATEIPNDTIDKLDLIEKYLQGTTFKKKAGYTFKCKIPKRLLRTLTIIKCTWSHERLQITKAILGEKEQNWRFNVPRHQTEQQCYNNQNSVILIQNQPHRSMEQNREPRNNPPHLCSINLQQSQQEYIMEKRQSLQKVVLGKLDSHV